MSGKKFKPPVKSKSSFPPEKLVSLTDAQYDEIFDAVLNAPKNEPENDHDAVSKAVLTSPTVAEQPPIQQAMSPKESASVENSQNAQENKTMKSITNKNTESTLSTINSEEFASKAVYSTPDLVKPKTYHQALKSLKQKMMNDSFSDISMNDSLNRSLIEAQQDGPLSQPPKKLTRRERLIWLRERRGSPLYIFCSKKNCKKWRLTLECDPVDIPAYWICSMNGIKELASCSVPEKPIPISMENDMIHCQYTAGSIVWAKIHGFPWWPAMVDDCPDCEQFYWMDFPLSNIPDWYHVVFLDASEVSRSWVLVKDIISFKHEPDFDKKCDILNQYKYRMRIAKEKANNALSLTIKERLLKYSFISLWKKELPEYSDSSDSDSDLSSNDSRYLSLYTTRSSIKSKKRNKKSTSSDSICTNLVQSQSGNESSQTTVASITNIKKNRKSKNRKSKDTNIVKRKCTVEDTELSDLNSTDDINNNDSSKTAIPKKPKVSKETKTKEVNISGERKKKYKSSFVPPVKTFVN